MNAQKVLTLAWLVFLIESYLLYNKTTERFLIYTLLQLILCSLVVTLLKTQICFRILYAFCNIFISISLIVIELLTSMFSLIFFSTVMLFLYLVLFRVSIVVVRISVEEDEQRIPNIIVISDYIKEEKVFEECCSICLSSDDEQVVLVCGHHFHRTCIDEWLHYHNSCPVCRTTYPQ